MIILREKHPDTGIGGIRWLYNQLAVEFSAIAQNFLRWSLEQHGIFLESKASEREVLTALNKIDKALAKLKLIDDKFQFDKPVLASMYQVELTSCNDYLKDMRGSLNTIWSNGDPGKKDVPFQRTTSFRFIYEKLVNYMDRANARAKSINKKASSFNQANKNLPPLPRLLMLTAPEWIRKM